MPRGVPFVMTRAKGIEGFSYAPEYFVYTTQIGPNLVECYASVLLHPHLMIGPPERSHIFSGIGSSPKAVIQVSAYNALTSPRRRYSELNCSYTFAYFSYQVTRSVNEVLYPHPLYEDDTRSCRMSELTRSLDVMY